MTAFEVGIQDAFHPIGLATLLVFVFFLIRKAYRFDLHLMIGAVFFTMIWYGHVFLVMGQWDAFLTDERIWTILKFWNVLIAGFLIFQGVGYWMQWWRVRVKKESTLVPPRDISQGKWKLLWQTFQVLVCAIVTALGLIAASAIFIQDYTVFIMILNAHSKEVMSPEKGFIAAYTCGYIVVMAVVWMILGLRFVKRFQAMRQTIQPFFFVVMSACCLAVGVGLILNLISI